MRTSLLSLALIMTAGTMLLAACEEESAEPGPEGGGTATATPTGMGGSVGGNGAGGGVGGTGATGAGATGGNTSCPDDGPGEPNDQAVDAVNLVVLSDDNPDPWPTFSGVIAGSEDVDWYTYLGSDDMSGYVDPERAFQSGGADLMLCAYFWCTDAQEWGPPALGEETVGLPHECPPGTETATADLSSVPYGNTTLGVAHGCCTEPGTTTFHLGEDFWTTFWPFTCPSASSIVDDMMVFIRVSAHPHAAADTCVPYVIEYHF